MEKIICPRCGYENLGFAKICFNCGENLEKFIMYSKGMELYLNGKKEEGKRYFEKFLKSLFWKSKYLSKYYTKPWTSLLAFIIEYGVMSLGIAIIFAILSIYVVEFRIGENFLIRILYYAVLMFIPIFVHEFGHFLAAYLKGYYPILTPMWATSDREIIGENSSAQILAATIVLGGEPSRFVSAMGPLMNLFVSIIIIVLLYFDWNNFSSDMLALLGMLVVFNGLYFIYNAQEIIKIKK